MFCNLGEVLVAHHSPLRLAAVRARVEAGSSLDAASVAEFGFTYDRLAEAVAAQWKLAPFLTAVRAAKGNATDNSRLARFGHELTYLMCARTAEHHEPGSKLLLIRYGASLRLTTEALPPIWERAVDDTRATFANLGIAPERLEPPLNR